jgi:hypothetical protein
MQMEAAERRAMRYIYLIEADGHRPVRSSFDRAFVSIWVSILNQSPVHPVPDQGKTHLRARNSSSYRTT